MSFSLSKFAACFGIAMVAAGPAAAAELTLDATDPQTRNWTRKTGEVFQTSHRGEGVMVRARRDGVQVDCYISRDVAQRVGISLDTIFNFIANEAPNSPSVHRLRCEGVVRFYPANHDGVTSEAVLYMTDLDSKRSNGIEDGATFNLESEAKVGAVSGR